MVNRMKFYIDGAWVDPAGKKTWAVVNPATEEAMYEIAVGSKEDIDKAVAAARRAFATFSRTNPRRSRGAADAYRGSLQEARKGDRHGDF
jgi:aldehyde dehydrogenase (NAD+)